MTDTIDLERRLRHTLHAVAPAPAADLADRLLEQTAQTPQRRSWLRGWAIPALSAAAVAGVAIVIGLQLGGLVRGPEGSMGIGPSGVPNPSPSGTAAAPPAGMTPCANPTDGYAVSYPADWYANPAIAAPEGLDPVAACRFFAEEPFEIRPNAGVPASVAITFQVVPDVRPAAGTLVAGEEQTTVGGHAALVREVETGAGAFMPAGTLIYEYFVALDEGFLLVSTDSSRDGDYAEHTRMIDRMMETLQLG